MLFVCLLSETVQLIPGSKTRWEFPGHHRGEEKDVQGWRNHTRGGEKVEPFTIDWRVLLHVSHSCKRDDTFPNLTSPSFLSLSIVNANLDPTLPPTQSLTDEEVLGNLTTLLFAGHDTSSSALSWTLLELSRNQELQRRLREECRAVEEDTPGL